MSPTSQNPADAGHALRMMALHLTPENLGVQPTANFPKIFGVVMDWPLGDNTVTLVALSDGTASLYTTSTFGVIGGITHEKVRAAAMHLVKLSNQFFDDSKATAAFPFPAGDKINFYLLGYKGQRVLEADRAMVESERAPCSSLFRAAQQVLTELRAIAQNK